MILDTNFKFYTDSNGGDPDSASPTLKKYHKILWSKPLPNGQLFNLQDGSGIPYLSHKSQYGEFYLGSDAISHSYRKHKRKKEIIEQVKNDAEELFELGSTIGGYILFPNNKIDGQHTINQARGVNSLIDDRFDLTLECIRLFYKGEKSPLYDTLLRYKDYFELFVDFNSYINFFFLQDLVDDNDKIKFYLPFDNFKTRPQFSRPEDYLVYKENVSTFLKKRNDRIGEYVKKMAFVGI